MSDSWRSVALMTDTKTALVTGAASGIGRALATELGAQGYELILCDIDGESLDAVFSELSAKLAIEADVADADAMQGLADQAGSVDLLCLNAGITGSNLGPPWESSADEWQQVLDINLGGMVNGLRAFVPGMVERGVSSNILITASLAGTLTWPGGGPYIASKHAVLAVAEQAALELSSSDISVTVLCPALVRTAMSAEGEDPAVVAQRALNAVVDGRFAVVDDEWSSAIRARAEMLVSGDQPQIPNPD
jgi:NADP-dependent 3-hydroxy acid dehydrogenase YdfG